MKSKEEIEQAAAKGDDVISKEEILYRDIQEQWCEGDTVPQCKGWLLETMEEYANQFKSAPQAVKWVQASERLPDKPKPYHCKDNGRLKIYTLGDIKLLRDITKIEWLDEGSTDKNQTK